MEEQQPPVDDGVTTVAAGVEELEQITCSASALSAQQEDLLLQNRILVSRLQEERLTRQRLEEEIKFYRHQVHVRDKRLDAAEADKTKLESRIAQLQRLCDERDVSNNALKATNNEVRNQLDSAKSKILELQRQIRCSGQPNAVAAVPDRRFEEAFRDKVAIIRLGKTIRDHFAQREAMMQAVERSAMEGEDERSNLAHEFGVIDKVPVRRGSTDGQDDDPQVQPRRRASSLVCFESVKRHGRGQGVTLPYRERLDLTTPQDGFVEAKILSSAFHEHLGPLRQSLLKIVADLKDSNDKTLTSLYYIFEDSSKNGRGLLANPKEDFEKEIKQSIVGLRLKFHDILKVLHTNVVQMINSEKPLRLRWALEGRARTDFSVQVDIPTPEDPRIAELKEQLSFVNGRNSLLRNEFTQKTSQLELLKDKAEVNTQYIQQKLFLLHDALYQSLHAVYRHRYHWIARFTNSFISIDRNTKRSAALEVNFNVKLGQAVEEDLHYLRKFADYFVSDELFGADMAAPSLAESNGNGQMNSNVNSNYLVAKRKDSMPVRRKIDNARKLSGQVESYLREELKQQQNVNVDPYAAPDRWDSDRDASAPSTPSGTPRGTPSSATLNAANDENATAALVGLLSPTTKRTSRSATNSPDLKGAVAGKGIQRPQSARTRSAQAATVIPSKPPIAVRRPSAANAADAGEGLLRRTVSGLKRSASPSTYQQPEVLACAKVTLQLGGDCFGGHEDEYQPATLSRPSSAKNLLARRPVNY